MDKMKSNKSISNDEKLNYVSKRILHIVDKQNVFIDTECLNKIGLKLLKCLKQSMEASGGCIYINSKAGLQLTNKISIDNVYQKNLLSKDFINNLNKAIVKNEGILVENNDDKSFFFKNLNNLNTNKNHLIIPFYTKKEKLLVIVLLSSKINTHFLDIDKQLGKIVFNYTYKFLYDEFIKEKLIASEVEYSNLINTLPVGIYRTNKKGEILFANKKLAEIFEFSNPQELKEHNVFEFFIDRKSRVKQIISWKQDDITTNIFQMKTKNNHKFWARDTGIIYNKGKKNQFFEGALEDISKIRKTEETYMLLYNVVEQMNESLLITNVEGIIEYVNPTFEKQTGYKFLEILGKKPSILKSGQHEKEFYKNLWNTISSGNIWKNELVNKDRNGNLFVEYAIIFPIKNTENQITHFAAVKRNITKEKKLEEQLSQSQKMESIGRLAGGIAHDFNNILTVISGYADLLIGSRNPGSTEWKQLSTILQSADTAQKLTKQLLSFSRHDKIESSPLAIDKAIKGLKSMLVRLIEEDIDLIFQLNAKDSFILADEQQLQQILINLTVNAKDALENRRVKTINIATEIVILKENYLDLQIGTYVKLVISDTGVGIPKEIISNVFEPFFTTKNKDKGTGLGLSTVYGVVKQNKGEIEISSQLGVGTSFIIYWPVLNEDDYKENLIEKNDSESFEGNGSILLVEDEKTVREVTTDILESLGYTVYSCKDGVEGLTFFKDNLNKIDLVITDITMPKMNGKELALEIRKIAPETKIIFTSGYASQINKMQHETFIRKPYNLSELSILINEMLKDK